ncbi:unnamed protein product, partial [Ixodes pacificus]
MDMRNGVKAHSAMETCRLSSGAGPDGSHGDSEKNVTQDGHAFTNGNVIGLLDANGVIDENLNLEPPRKAEFIVDGDDSDCERSGLERAVTEEPLVSIFKQAALPFLLGGLGTVFAGLILDAVQSWPAFRHITELFIVVPPLLGLKGNLEMTLAARLSTQANLGHMKTVRQQWDVAVGNMALVQCQACVLSLLSSVFAIVMGLVSDDTFRLDQALFVAACSMCTAAIASFLLGSVMILVVAHSGRCHVNPDNIATSVVDALGDMTTLAILAGLSSIFYSWIGDLVRLAAQPWFSGLFVAGLASLSPVWVLLARGHPTSRKVLRVGWWPIIVAMAISSAGGFILDIAVSRFSGLAAFQPVINGKEVYFCNANRLCPNAGVNGNLAAIHASRLSTLFAQRSQLGRHPEDDSRSCVDPFTALCRRNRQARVSQLLLALSLPGHLLFVVLVFLMSEGNSVLTAPFVACYLVASTVLVS